MRTHVCNAAFPPYAIKVEGGWRAFCGPRAFLTDQIVLLAWTVNEMNDYQVPSAELFSNIS